MKKTLISFFHNEQYLLPWFLRHHRDVFDRGILVNNGSNDASVDIIKRECPGWEIIEAPYDEFCDIKHREFLEQIEKGVEGWKLCLNVTEQLVGDVSIIDSLKEDKVYIDSHIFVDDNPFTALDHDVPLYKQRAFGYYRFPERRYRCFHRTGLKYNPGRHFVGNDVRVEDRLGIFFYGWCPFNEESIARRLQFVSRCSPESLKQGFGFQHAWDRETILAEYEKARNRSKDLSDVVSKYCN